MGKNIRIDIILEAVEIIRENIEHQETIINQLALIKREAKELLKTIVMFGG